MGAYADIHAHILPGIDDGPDDLAQSLEMARAAVDAGIATIASTPHLRQDFPDVRIRELAGRCQALREAFDRERIPITLVSAAEASLTWAIEASKEELSLASYGQRGTDLLVETPTINVVGVDRLLYALQARGYRLTLAHPERSLEFQRNRGTLRALVGQGVLLQVNADSLLGPGGGRGVKRLARELVTAGLAHVIASDGHRGTKWRPVARLCEAVDAAAELVGPERATWMAHSVPQAIIDGSELPKAPPISLLPRQRRRLLGLGHRY